MNPATALGAIGTVGVLGGGFFVQQQLGGIKADAEKLKKEVEAIIPIVKGVPVSFNNFGKGIKEDNKKRDKKTKAKFSVIAEQFETMKTVLESILLSQNKMIEQINNVTSKHNSIVNSLSTGGSLPEPGKYVVEPVSQHNFGEQITPMSPLANKNKKHKPSKSRRGESSSESESSESESDSDSSRKKKNKGKDKKKKKSKRSSSSDDSSSEEEASPSDLIANATKRGKNRK